MTSRWPRTRGPKGTATTSSRWPNEESPRVQVTRASETARRSMTRTPSAAAPQDAPIRDGIATPLSEPTGADGESGAEQKPEQGEEPGRWRPRETGPRQQQREEGRDQPQAQREDLNADDPAFLGRGGIGRPLEEHALTAEVVEGRRAHTHTLATNRRRGTLTRNALRGDVRLRAALGSVTPARPRAEGPPRVGRRLRLGPAAGPDSVRASASAATAAARAAGADASCGVSAHRPRQVAHPCIATLGATSRFSGLGSERRRSSASSTCRRSTPPPRRGEHGHVLTRGQAEIARVTAKPRWETRRKSKKKRHGLYTTKKSAA